MILEREAETKMGVPSHGRPHVKVEVTLSSSEAEFVAASQAGQEVLYLRALLKGFAYLQVLQRFGKITRLVSL